MQFHHWVPGPPLSEFVELLWLYEGYTQPHEKERLLPDGTMELVINLHEDRARIYDPRDSSQFRTLRGSLLAGPHSQFFVIDTAGQYSVIGAHFRPGGGFPFFDLPAGELHNTLVSLEDLWGGRAGELRERLLAAPIPAVKFHVLEQALLARAAHRLERHRAVSFALGEFRQRPNARAIADVTDQIGLSAKRFIQVFNDQVGLTPKLFCRVRRFQRAIHSLRRGQPVAWAAVAADCGYFDQAHFIHDFRAFSGINPTAYLTHCTEHLNHVPMVD